MAVFQIHSKENLMKNKGLWFGSAIFAILAVIFAFTDWQISQALYNPGAGWAHFMEAYGQMPGSFLGLLCGSLLLRTYKVEKTAKSVFGVIGLYLLTALAAFGFFADAFGAQVDTSKVNLPAVLTLTLAALILGQVILRWFSLEALSPYKNIAKVGLAVMIVGGIATVWLFKIPWGRWTYRDILEAGNAALFTPWYLPQGNNGHHSFFSGHTAMVFSVLPIVLLFKKKTQARNMAIALALLWGVIGGLSRIVVGAHFASDVLFGAGETLLWFWFLRNKFAPDA
jgi:membrane-associated phospholipid phosphatase